MGCVVSAFFLGKKKKREKEGRYIYIQNKKIFRENIYIFIINEIYAMWKIFARKFAV